MQNLKIVAWIAVKQLCPILNIKNFDSSYSCKIHFYAGMNFFGGFGGQ